MQNCTSFDNYHLSTGTDWLQNNTYNWHTWPQNLRTCVTLIRPNDMSIYGAAICCPTSQYENRPVISTQMLSFRGDCVVLTRNLFTNRSSSLLFRYPGSDVYEWRIIWLFLTYMFTVFEHAVSSTRLCMAPFHIVLCDFLWFRYLYFGSIGTIYRNIVCNVHNKKHICFQASSQFYERKPW